MNRTSVLWIALLVIVGLAALRAGAEREKETPASISIPAEQVADYVHAVIQADRTFYTVQVVERLQLKGAIVAAHNWRKTNTLPLPAQFLQESAQLAALTGSKAQYRLISLWPINPLNGPATVFEQTGLQAVLKDPERPYTGVVTDGGEKYFQAVYADLAVTQTCIGCHNAQPSSPKKDFKLHDVMGGVVISFPVP